MWGLQACYAEMRFQPYLHPKLSSLPRLSSCFWYLRQHTPWWRYSVFKQCMDSKATHFVTPSGRTAAQQAQASKSPILCLPSFHSLPQCSLLITPPSYPFLQEGQQCPAAFEATKPRCLTDYRPTSKSFPQASVSPGKMKSATVPHPSGLDLWGPNRIQGK